MTQTASEQLSKAKERLRAGDFAAAYASAEEVRLGDEGNAEGWYLSAVALRLQRSYEEALVRLHELQHRFPNFTLALQERGHLSRDRGEQPHAALDCYLEAVRRNPTLRAAWQSVLRLAVQLGDDVLSARASAQLTELDGMPVPLRRARHALAERDMDRAEVICREYLRANPLDVSAMRLLAAIGVERQVYDDAEYLLESALEVEPDNLEARMEYAGVLFKRHRYQRVASELSRLLTLQPEHLAALLLRGHLRTATGRYTEALQDYRRIEPRLQSDETFQVAIGHALKTVGQSDDAIARYRRAYELRRDFGDAYWSLANLKTYRFTPDEVAAMEEALANPGLRDTDRIHLSFSLGKAHEDAERFEKAFQHYDRGNALRRRQSRFSAEKFENGMRACRDVYAPGLFERLAGSGSANDAPIFIVGLPRSGSTLLEQILSAHSQVEGTKELAHIPGIVHELSRGVGDVAYPDNVVKMAADEFARLGEHYLESAAQQRQTSAPYFIDKMPNNFRHVGLIHLMLPNSKIIDIRRHPTACCFSNYKQFFAEGQEFSYSFEDIGNYYLSYLDIMAHWDAVLPGRVLRVNYEALVGDLEGELRRVLEYCGLPFEESCLEYHAQQRAVRTASSEQVRQPIYHSGLNAWRSFEPFLGDLIRILQPAIEAHHSEVAEN
ncbi:TPR domain protein [Luminiphilus syltensis NOR5-1B]|uniref:TPR domain protein n=1 Tax=Luminiphilus syltensis NOR5-1B TaxID=565045 RepID=B8KY61_9GAMM|nr:tetratricopeptide repeat-containing sulfotransferase family protein [Luminiphilus syltensis]EED34196.1 TPR domain protein [Luminiphilus syltensis NOR5-1B]